MRLTLTVCSLIITSTNYVCKKSGFYSYSILTPFWERLDHRESVSCSTEEQANEGNWLNKRRPIQELFCYIWKCVLFATERTLVKRSCKSINMIRELTDLIFFRRWNLLLIRERSISRGNEKCPTDSSFSHRNSFHSFRHVRFLKCHAWQRLQRGFIRSHMVIETVQNNVVRFGDIWFH